MNHDEIAWFTTGKICPKCHKSVNPFITMTKQITASEMGKIGGARKSEKKTKAARENAKKPRKKNTKAQARPALPDAQQPTNETK